MTNYVVVNNDLSETEVTATKSSGSQLHILDEGPTIGLKYAYSGEVVTGVTYIIDQGPTIGLARSTS